jgi:amino acid adenylation domain-containing protein
MDQHSTRTDSSPTHTRDRLPATRQQQQLWFLDRLDAGGVTYNLGIAFRLRGDLSGELLERALTEIARRHETLRTTFTEEDGVPHQVVAPARPVALAVDDLSGTPLDARDAAAARHANDEVRRPFDLVRGPLFRARLARFGVDDHVLVLTIHHICWDVRSTSLLCDELSHLYNAMRAGREPSLPEPRVQHSDYTRWQRERLRSPQMAEHLEFWKAKLANLPVLELPADRPRPPVPSFRSDAVMASLGGAELRRLRDLAAAGHTTLLTVLVAAYCCVVARYTGQEDIVIASIVDARTTPEMRTAMGFITNSVVLRVDMSGDPTFDEVLARAQETLSEAWRHREVPFEMVVSGVQAERDSSRNPLWQAGVQLFDRDTGASVPELDGIHVEPVGASTGQHPVDTSIFGIESPDRLDVVLNYATDLFDRPRSQRMLGHFRRLLEAGAGDPSLRLSALPLLTETERTRVLETWQGQRRPWRRQVVHQLIAEQAARTPDAIAVTFEGREITYGELDRRAGLLARRLRADGTGREDFVGVALGRGLEEIVALLAVMKAGGAFVMLDTTQPPRRLAHILADTAARFVITRSDVTGLPEPDGWMPLHLDREWAGIEAIPTDRPLEELATPESLIYAMYTSGSTGQPKGVLVEHEQMAVFIGWHSEQFEVGPDARMLQPISLLLDFAQGQIFSALSMGATLVTASQETVLQPAELEALLRRERITYMGAPPAMLGAVSSGPYPDLRYVLVGGEAYSGELVNRWNQPGRQFVNGYGPTETTVGCTRYVCEHREWRSSPPIGRAMPNRLHYIVDRWGCPTPVGVPGELLIGGLGVARGYMNRPDLTAEKFVADPFNPGHRVYRSGDLTYWTEEGQIQFVGRIDSQIKLRGLRIELEEIETVVASHPDIAHAAVVLREDSPGDRRIVAYLVGRNGEPPSATDLRVHASQDLPGHMLPTTFVTLQAMPLAPNGKVDRRALPPPPSERRDGDHVAPRTRTEAVIAETFGQVLTVDRVGALDSFFELGGNSLMATRVIARLQERLGSEITIRDLYVAPAVAELARTVGTRAVETVVTRPSGGRS